MENEKPGTNLDVMLSLREGFSGIADRITETGRLLESAGKPEGIASLEGIEPSDPKTFTVIDAGSQTIDTAMDTLYFYGALSVDEKNSRRMEGPHIGWLSDLDIEEDNFDGEGYMRARDAVSLLRESLVLKMAAEEIERRKPDLILLDGPLIIREAYKRFEGMKSFGIFMKALDRLDAVSEDVPVIGFVKRAQSRFFLRGSPLLERHRRLRDPVFLDAYMNKGQYFPSPPTQPNVKFFREQSTRYVYTYFKPQNVSKYPPFRVDFNARAAEKHGAWLAWLLKNSGNSVDGLPYFLHHTDREVRMERILASSLYNHMRGKIPIKYRHLCKLVWGE